MASSAKPSDCRSNPLGSDETMTPDDFHAGPPIPVVEDNPTLIDRF